MSEAEADWFSHPRFATQLEARVVDTSGAEPRIHGFGVRSDLVKYFSVADVMLLALTGNEPSRRTSEALRRALVLLTPIDVGAAPTHLGVLTQLVSRDYPSSVAAAGTLLAQRAAQTVNERADLMDSLRRGAPPSGTIGTKADGDDGALRALFADVSDLALQPWFCGLDTTSAAIAVLFDCGLKERWQLESLLFWAWCPCVMAEMGSRGSDALETYPINLPRFRYVAG